MPTALMVRSQTTYILASERETTNPTRFVLRGLSVEERAIYADQGVKRIVHSDGTASWSTDVGTQQLLLLRAGLIGWENFNDQAGTPVPFEKGPECTVLGRRCTPISDASLERLDPSWHEELARAVLNLNTLKEADRKN